MDDEQVNLVVLLYFDSKKDPLEWRKSVKQKLIFALTHLLLQYFSIVRSLWVDQKPGV